ncbi:flap endonuclease-1 [mine drainage metagenome]|uniref:Flap endonuclease-1 n=1 Tax=mine drainage metagenome TaxID=410659 RepID=T0ZII4_9ZZZZ
MSVDLSKMVYKYKISLEELRGKRIAIDAYNMIYQFLSIIRQPDGTPLTDSKGNVTSHMSGLFYRTVELIDKGIHPIYVFDGIPSVLKQKTIAARMKRRQDALAAWESAKLRGETEEARTQAQASTRITKYIVETSKALLDHMGVYYITAPSEGEAQASRMCRDGLVYAAASQDYDTLLFGAPLVARNVTLSGRRKLPRKNVYVNVEPEMMSLSETLKGLGITQEKLIWIGLMLGTDFNEGIKGIGPKTALKIVKGVSSVKALEAHIKGKYNAEFELDINEVIALFEKPEVKSMSEEELSAGMSKSPDKAAILKFMCDDHGFGAERIAKYADKLVSDDKSQRQVGLGSWIK